MDDILLDGFAISRRSKTQPPSESDLRKEIVARKVDRMRCEIIGVIGAEFTGRNTLVRRFRHMSEGAFDGPEDRKYTRRTVFVELSKRPFIRINETVKLDVHILNARSREVYEYLSKLKSIALVFDVRSERSLNVATSCMIRMRQTELGALPHLPFIIIGNKSDRPPAPHALREIRRAARSCGAERYYECSALENYNMDSVLDAIVLMTFYPGRFLPH